MTDETPDSPEKPELKDARQNPWYVLMTVAGEQPADASWFHYDEYLHAQNRRYFNGWMAQSLSEAEKQNLIEAKCATAADLAELEDHEVAAIEKAFTDRCPQAEPITSMQPHCDLTNSKITRGLICRGFVFSGDAHFSHTTFLRGAFFQGTTFSGIADFQAATFSGLVFFQGTIFSHFVFFQGATFSNVADFSDAKFKSQTLFSPFRRPDKADKPVCFEHEPPRFFNAELHEDTSFTKVRWPPMPCDDATKERENRASRHRRSYERLKLLMDEKKNVADEHLFHRRELMCKEVEEEGTPTAYASRAFGWLCDYGWDPVRPGQLLLGLVTFGWATIFCAEWFDYNLGTWGEHQTSEYLGFWQSGALSVSNVFGFLGLSRTFLADEIKTLTTVSEVVSASQTVFGLVLFFLLGLALRNRFRLK
ncbi:MAG: pentapeptide repeat-containing protein [Pseudomonadota bacterium]